jgi:DHA1 family bicyclomycin/chloramphenicol resistance-like MFS transporter
MSKDASARPLRLALILGSLSAFGPITTDLYLPALPATAVDLATSQASIQGTLTACLIGLALGQVFIGPLSDGVGRRRPMVAGMALFILSSLACATAGSVYLLLAARLVQGLAGSAGIVLSLAIVRDLFSGVAAGRMIAGLMAVGGVAPIVAPLVGAQLLRVTSWRGLFVVLAGLGVVLLILALAAVPETLPPRQRRPVRWSALAAGYAALARDRRFVGLTVGGALAFGVMFAYISTSSFIFQTHYGYTEAEFSFVFATNAVGLLTLNLIGGRLLGRVSAAMLVRVGMAGMLVGSAGALAALAWGGPGTLIPALFVTVSSLGLVMPTAAAMALEPHAELAGTASAGVGAGRYIVGGVLAAVAGLGGDPVVLGVVMVASAVAAAIAFIWARAAVPAAR